MTQGGGGVDASVASVLPESTVMDLSASAVPTLDPSSSFAYLPTTSVGGYHPVPTFVQSSLQTSPTAMDTDTLVSSEESEGQPTSFGQETHTPAFRESTTDVIPPVPGTHTLSYFQTTDDPTPTASYPHTPGFLQSTDGLAPTSISPTPPQTTLMPTPATSSENTPATNSASLGTPKPSLCACRCCQRAAPDPELVPQRVLSLRSELEVEKVNLSSTWRSKNSVMVRERVAVTAGGLGVAVLVLVGLALFAFDVSAGLSSSFGSLAGSRKAAAAAMVGAAAAASSSSSDLTPSVPAARRQPPTMTSARHSEA